MNLHAGKEIEKVAKTLIFDMFKVKKGETIGITGDTDSNREFAELLASTAHSVGALPLIMWTPKAPFDGQAGISYWPAEPLTAALSKIDVWIELQTSVILYSDIWEKAFKNNKKLRYIILGDSSIPSLTRTLTSFDIKTLGYFLAKVKDLCMKATKIRITSQNGTDVSYNTNLNYFFDYDDGDLSKPRFGTAPGYVNIVPKKNSMNGSIVFDLLMNADIYNSDNSIEFIMQDGDIVDVIGTTQEVEKFKDYLSSFNDPNMYKISHNMLGFNPGIRKLSGEIVEDERIWGGVDFGFGHTSPMDMPPNGQPAKSHFDGVVEKASIYLDDLIIVNNGEVCHSDLIPIAQKLIANNL
jgi:leucyl aminopeptidase (aminopeptidase T)